MSVLILPLDHLLPVSRLIVGIKHHLEFLSAILFCWRVFMPKVLPSLDLPLLGLEPGQLVWVPGVLFADPSVSLTHIFFVCNSNDYFF